MDTNSVFLKSVGKVKDMAVNDSYFDIGRCRTAKLILPNLNISRNHCQLELVDNLYWLLKDFSSSGTYVNEQLVGKGNSVQIKNNDVLRLGPKECSFIWQFKTSTINENSLGYECSMNSQSQSIVDICIKKDSLQQRIILNSTEYQEMAREKKKLEKECLNQVKILEEKFLMESQKVENQSEIIQKEINKQMEEEKKRVYEQMKMKTTDLQERINFGAKMEKDLKAEIQVLQQKIIDEQLQWENRFLEEKKKLEKKISEQEEKLSLEKMKVKEISETAQQDLENELKKKEQEKNELIMKLREMEESRDVLSRKLMESNELHLQDKARLEEEIQRELSMKQEKLTAQLQEQIQMLKKTQIEIENNLKAEFEEKENTKNKDLLRELDRVKAALNETEYRKKLLEKELEEAGSLKDEVSKVKSNVLENIADLMETELQCSVCSELFVNAITLNCTHTFCKYCINRWKKKKKNCPICRKKITSENRSIAVDNYIDKMVEKLSENFKSRRQMIISERLDEVTEKKIKTVQHGTGSLNNSYDQTHQRS